MSKPVWSDQIEEAAWREKNCRVCFQPNEALKRVFATGEGCPLLLLASAGKLPQQWTRRRNAALGETYRCSEHLDRPRISRRPASKPAETPPMFDVDPAPNKLVPVEGWPDLRPQARGTAETDHS